MSSNSAGISFMTEVELPDSVSKVEQGAFHHCNALSGLSLSTFTACLANPKDWSYRIPHVWLRDSDLRLDRTADLTS
jgi:hypothetical protein